MKYYRLILNKNGETFEQYNTGGLDLWDVILNLPRIKDIEEADEIILKKISREQMINYKEK